MKEISELKENWYLQWTSFKFENKELFSDSTDGWIKATVPGDIHIDLMNAGLLPDPLYGDNAEFYRWTEEKEFWYKTTFHISATEQGERVFLVFEGIDTFATIYLNGKEICKNSNMFVPAEKDITDIAKKGKNQIIVKIAPAVFSVDMNSDTEVKNDPFFIPRLFARKTQFNYGWDIAPRLISAGIWRPVKIIKYRKGRIRDFHIETLKIEDNHACLKFETEIDLFDKVKNGEILLKIFDNGKKVVEIREKIAFSKTKESFKKEFKIENPRLWYPNVSGRVNLYAYEFSLNVDGKKIDELEGKFGIKKIELIQEPQSDGGTSFCFKINGEKIFIKGFNWTPLEVFPGRIKKMRYEEMLKLVKEANANMLRVWGGGFYEDEDFYNLCDEYGIMVWQDFMFACGWYPQNREFCENVKREGEYIVRKLRRHVSLSLWCGGNENDEFRFWRVGEAYRSHTIARKILKPLCKKLNPEIPFIPDSPFSQKSVNPNEPFEGDIHRWGHGKSYKDDFYVNIKPRFVSEIGHLSVPSKKVLLTFIPSDKLWPPFNKYWFYHSSDTLRCGCQYRIGSLFDSIKNNNLEKPENIDEFIEATQNLQAEACKFWIEYYSSIPECAGILLWNVSDCWPQISDSIIAYPDVPKKAYYKIKEAFSKIKSF